MFLFHVIIFSRLRLIAVRADNTHEDVNRDMTVLWGNETLAMFVGKRDTGDVCGAVRHSRCL